MIASIWLVSFAMAAQVPPPRAASAESAELREVHRAILERETADLKTIADRLGGDGRKAEAESVLKRVEPAPPDEGPMRFVPLPEVVPARTDKTPADEVSRQVTKVRETAARAYHDLAVRALSGNAKHYSLADGCLRAVLDRDPDHAEARRLLGYVPHAGGWATPFAAQKLKAHNVLHPTYGWVAEDWVPHLEQGQLPAQGATGREPRWVPAAEADASRDRIERAWQIYTEHFQIMADVPLAEAITFGRLLESFHDLFFSMLADVIADDLPLARRFRDKSSASARPSLPHTVFYFRDKDEFVTFLDRRKGVDVAKSLGYYDPTDAGKQRRSTAYFFRDPGGQLEVTATLFHEVSHQLLFESTGVGATAYLKNHGNYWVFEGLGTYFETVNARPDGSINVGGFVSPRIVAAQNHLLGGGDFIPIGQFVRLGKNDFDDEKLVYLHYAEAMALTVFLMDGHHRLYREDFLDYVRDAHRGRFRGDNGHALEARLGVPYKTLDAEFLDELKPREKAAPKAEGPASER